MITNPVFTNQSESGNGQEPTNIQRRTLIGGALAALFSSSVRVMAKENDEQIMGPFIMGPFTVFFGHQPHRGCKQSGERPAD